MLRNVEERLVMMAKGAIGFAALMLCAVGVAWPSVFDQSLPEAYQFAAVGGGALIGSVLGWRSVKPQRSR